MPDFMKRALTENGLTRAYKARPAYQQNDYVWWITSPAREPTRTLNRNTVEIRLQPFRKLTEGEQQALRSQVARYGGFLGTPVVLAE